MEERRRFKVGDRVRIDAVEGTVLYVAEDGWVTVQVVGYEASNSFRPSELDLLEPTV